MFVEDLQKHKNTKDLGRILKNHRKFSISNDGLFRTTFCKEKVNSTYNVRMVERMTKEIMVSGTPHFSREK